MILGRTDSELCPVAEVLAYMGVRAIAPGPFCQFADGMLFTRGRFVEAIQSALFSVGITATSYSGNSFSYGATTSACMLYVRTSRVQLCSVARFLI